MKRILYAVSTTKFYSGAEWSLLRLVKGLKGRYDIGIVMPDRGPLFKKCQELGIRTVVIPYVPLGSRALRFPAILWFLCVNSVYLIRLVATIVLRRIDLVHVNEIYNLPALVAGKLSFRRVVVHLRAGVLPPGPFRRIIPWIVASLASKVVCVSESVRRLWFRGKKQLAASTVIHNVHPDIERFSPKDREDTPGKTFTVGSLSKICSQKGQHYLVEAAALIRKATSAGFKALIAGGALEGHEEYYERLLAGIRDRGLEDTVIVSGMTANPARQLASMDVFAHTPDFPDPFPTVVLEAMMMKRPVVAFDSGGIGEQFEDGVSGVLVPHGDVARLAESILELFQDPERRRQIGENGRKHALETLSPESISEQVVGVYDALLS